MFCRTYTVSSTGLPRVPAAAANSCRITLRTRATPDRAVATPSIEPNVPADHNRRIRMADRIALFSTDAPAPASTFSQGVRRGPLLQVSGQGPVDPATNEYVHR